MTTDEQTMTDIGTNKAQRTGRHLSRPEEVLFFPTAHFLFFNFMAAAHLAHCLLPANTQARQKGKSQRAKFPNALFLTPYEHI